jgi:hypothetical protein
MCCNATKGWVDFDNNWFIKIQLYNSIKPNKNPIKMKTRERQENAIETRSVTLGDLTEFGRLTRAK